MSWGSIAIYVQSYYFYMHIFVFKNQLLEITRFSLFFLCILTYKFDSSMLSWTISKNFFYIDFHNELGKYYIRPTISRTYIHILRTKFEELRNFLNFLYVLIY